jgi:hypothetical protein
MTVKPMLIDTPSAESPRSGFLWTTPEMYDPERKRPAFSVKVTAEVFFGMSGSWLRKHQRQSNFSTELGQVEPLRTPVKYHLYRLYDIERLGHTFAKHQVIDGVHLERIVTMVRIVAQIYGYLPLIDPPSLESVDEMPLGHVGFWQLMPQERADAFHLVNRLIDATGEEMPPLSCAHFGDHRKSTDCNVLLDQAVYGVKELERHLRREETD